MDTPNEAITVTDTAASKLNELLAVQEEDDQVL